MIRGRDILRLPVITRDMGKRVGQVEDLIIDRKGSRLLGIVVGEKGLLGSTRVVAWSGILVPGIDAVIIDSESSVVKASAVPEIEEVLERGFVLEGTSIQTTAGRELGRVENVFVDRATGVVQGYELVGGLNEQQPSGRAFMPAHPSFEAGKDYNFVDPSVADTLEDFAAAVKARAN
jgi:uncharacterized protein YrrD